MIKRIHVLVLLVATLLTPPLWATDGTMKFSGKLTENACEIVSKNINVDLGPVLLSELGLFHDEPFARGTEFELVLDKCPANTNRASIKFEGVAEPANPTLFTLDNAGQPGVAKGIGIRFLMNNVGIMIPNEIFPLSQLLDALPGKRNNIKLFAHYFGLPFGSALATGSTNTTVQFSVMYN